MTTESHHCGLCGTPVEVVLSGEGTSHYRPALAAQAGQHIERIIRATAAFHALLVLHPSGEFCEGEYVAAVRSCMALRNLLGGEQEPDPAGHGRRDEGDGPG